jgi:hypothetical protein
MVTTDCAAKQHFVSERVPAEHLLKKRKPRAPVGPTGIALVRKELLSCGFNVETVSNTRKCVLFIGSRSSLRPIQVRTVHLAPWYVRSENFGAAVAGQVTVYVLLGLEEGKARFFIARNGDLAAKLRTRAGWKEYGFIDLKAD